MKIQINTKPGSYSTSSASQRAAVARPSTSKTIEHRYERRKIREQLRRLDWALAGEW
jgi:hypothetical protein